MLKTKTDLQPKMLYKNHMLKIICAGANTTAQDFSAWSSISSKDTHKRWGSDVQLANY